MYSLFNTSWIQPLPTSCLSPSLQLFSRTYPSLSTSLLLTQTAKQRIYALARSLNCFVLNPYMTNNISSLGHHCSSALIPLLLLFVLCFLTRVCCDTVYIFHCLYTASRNIALTSTAQSPLMNVQRWVPIEGLL